MSIGKKADTVIMNQAYDLDEYEENSKDRETATHRNKLTHKVFYSGLGGVVVGSLLLGIVGIAMPPAAVVLAGVVLAGSEGVELYTYIRQRQRKQD